MARPRNPAPATTEAELAALEKAWEERGPAAIRAIGAADPAAYFRMMALAIELEGGFDDD